jgi:hypothetical protein
MPQLSFAKSVVTLLAKAQQGAGAALKLQNEGNHAQSQSKGLAESDH